MTSAWPPIQYFNYYHECVVLLDKILLYCIISQTRSEGTYFVKAFGMALFQKPIFEKVCTTDYLNAPK